MLLRAVISIVLAVVIVLLSRLPRPVLVLFVCSVIGAVFGVSALVTRSWVQACSSGPHTVEKCGGTYFELFGEHRLPQFMQGRHADAWLIGTGALFGVAVAVVVALVALVVMWAWSRLGHGERVANAT